MEIPVDLRNLLLQLTPQQLRFFACDSAEHVLPFFERYRTTDQRPRLAIEAARQYAFGRISIVQLRSAAGDAEGAAWEAAEDQQDIHTLDYSNEAIAATAATAEGCCYPDPYIAAEAAANTAIEVVVTAAIGVRAASVVWGHYQEELEPELLQQYRTAEALERAWQRNRAQFYLIQS